MPALISLGGKCKYTPGIFEMVKNMSPVIAADSGYVHCRCLDLVPDFLAGDMDSIPGEYLSDAMRCNKTKIKRYDTDKDQTDSEIAVDIALAEGCDSICFIGAFGERYDHMLANQMTAASLASRGVNCVLTDGITFMYTITPANSPFILKLDADPRNRDVISLIPVSSDLDHTGIEGLKYLLNDTKIPFGSQRAVSNKILPAGPGETTRSASVSVGSGVALLIHTISD